MKRDVLLGSHILDVQLAKTAPSVAPGRQELADASASSSKAFPFVSTVDAESVNNSRKSSFYTNKTKQTKKKATLVTQGLTFWHAGWGGGLPVTPIALTAPTFLIQFPGHAEFTGVGLELRRCRRLERLFQFSHTFPAVTCS